MRASRVPMARPKRRRWTIVRNPRSQSLRAARGTGQAPSRRRGCRSRSRAHAKKRKRSLTAAFSHARLSPCQKKARAVAGTALAGWGRELADQVPVDDETLGTIRIGDDAIAILIDREGRHGIVRRIGDLAVDGDG